MPCSQNCIQVKIHNYKEQKLTSSILSKYVDLKHCIRVHKLIKLFVICYHN